MNQMKKIIAINATYTVVKVKSEKRYWANVE